jgi:hypothetical protein
MLVDIDGNIEHHRLNFLFILQKNKNRSKHTCSIILGLFLILLTLLHHHYHYHRLQLSHVPGRTLMQLLISTKTNHALLAGNVKRKVFSLEKSFSCSY